MTTAVTIQQPETTAISTAVAPFLREAEAMTVVNRETHRAALEAHKQLTLARRNVLDLFEDPKRKAHEAHRAVCGAEKRLLDPIDAAIKVIDGKCTSYETEQKRIADDKRRELEEQQRKEEEDRRIAEAAAAENAGDHEIAETILDDAPLILPPVHVESQVAKVEGVSTRTTYRAEVVNLVELCRYIVAHPQFVNLVQANGPALNSLARAQRDALRIPGVRAVQETSRAVRSA